MESKNNL